MIRVAQLVLLLAAACLWVASRLTWVQISSFDGLGPPKTTELTGAVWSTALIPLALLVAAAAVAALAVRGWALRALALLVAVASAGMGYLAISLWMTVDIAKYAALLAQVPVADLHDDSQRHYGGAVVTLVAAALSLLGAVLLMRSATRPGSDAARYTRRRPAQADEAAAMSERMIWDALDEGSDPTQDRAAPDNQGR